MFFFFGISFELLCPLWKRGKFRKKIREGGFFNAVYSHLAITICKINIYRRLVLDGRYLLNKVFKILSRVEEIKLIFQQNRVIILNLTIPFCACVVESSWPEKIRDPWNRCGQRALTWKQCALTEAKILRGRTGLIGDLARV